MTTTEDGRHLALVVRDPIRPGHNRMRVIRDGVYGDPLYHEIVDVALSRDGSRMATLGRIKKQWFVDVDGTSSPPFDLVGARTASRGATAGGPGALAFSPDGQHVAYAVRQGRTTSMVLDGQAQGTWNDILFIQGFSPDGRRLAYWAKSNQGRVVVLDGVAHPADDLLVSGITRGTWWDTGIPPPPGVEFSPDGSRVAWTIKSGRKYCLVVDGTKGQEFDMLAVRPGIFDPKSGRLIYGAQRGDQWVIRVEDRDSLRGDGEIQNVGVLLSPAGGRLACVVRQGKGTRVIVDGQPWGEAFDAMYREDLVFSPDGDHLACLVRVGKEARILLDGKPLLAVPCEVAYNLRFSPDGSHLAWQMKRDGKWSVMLDGQRGPRFDVIFGRAPTFRVDGVIEYFAANAGMLYRIRHVPAASMN